MSLRPLNLTTFEASRRQVLQGVTAGIASTSLIGCASTDESYREIAAQLSRDAQPVEGSRPDQIRQLVFYASLAANGHNTQPWKFRPTPGGLSILPDFSRDTPVVDPDGHHLWASLGCACENVVVAAEASGMGSNIHVQKDRIDIALAQLPADPIDPALFRAIPRRQSIRAPYDGRAVSQDIIRRLEASIRSLGVDLVILDSAEAKEQGLELVVAGNTAQMADDDFIAELKSWIRFNEAHAARTRDGLFTGASGNPTVPPLIGRMFFSSGFNLEDENEKYSRQIRSSGFLAAFVAADDTPDGWIRAGRACQRFLLGATAEGLSCAFINQPLEVQQLRPQLAGFLGVPDRRPNLFIRVGFGPTLPRSLRRPVSDVILT